MDTVKPLRLWPGIAAALMMLVGRLLLPLVWPDGGLIGLLMGVAGALIIILWWAFFSRAPWKERVFGLAAIAIAVFAVSPLLDLSISNAGQGIMYFMYAVHTAALALVIWAIAARGISGRARYATMAIAILIGAGMWAALRTDGVSNSLLGSDFRWRWTPTAEQRLLAQTRDEKLVPAPAVAAETPAPAHAPAAPTLTAAANATPRTSEPIEPLEPTEPLEPAAWPGFRGRDRDGVIRGPRIATDWTATPPVALWRKAIGPGWSSFAVQGDLLYTQEQRGEDEVVACYKVSTGEPVWRHRDPVRFYESNGGAGPRATPSLGHGRVYALGATGILNALDARTGAVVWTRQAATDTSVATPGWGFAGSPLVVDDLVIVAASGALAGYDAATGRPQWTLASKGGGYSSPQIMTIDGVEQVVLMTGGGTVGVDPAAGTELWRAPIDGSAIVQTALADGDLLVAPNGMTGGNGIHRVSPRKGASGWTVEERWTSNGLKPYFNDFVVHKGHAYGFDGAILSSIELAGGTRKWKGGRYGNGQMVLLAGQDLLLVLSEDGEIVLVSATPDKFTEVAKVPALDGKTWNHPVVIGDLLLVRNGQEMAAFRLPAAR